MCSYNPELVTGPIGMFHCPQCGEMVIAGYKHPNYDSIDESYAEYCEEQAIINYRWGN